MLIQELPFNKGITLNMQQVEILSIIAAENKLELENIVKRIVNIDPEKSKTILYENELERAKQILVAEYKSSLLSINYGLFDTKHDQNIKQHIKKELVKRFCINSENANTIIHSAFQHSLKEQIVYTISKELIYDKDEISHFMANYQIVEYPGVKITPYEHWVKLYTALKDYEIIFSIDAISFNKYVFVNGQYNSLPLIKMLDFARQNKKMVQLGSLIHYKDMPTWVINAPFSLEMRKHIIKQLNLYIHNITTQIKQYEKQYDCQIVETIELLKEPLNQLENVVDFYRVVHIRKPWLRWFNKKRNPELADWLSYISLKDICDMSRIIRNVLPHVKIRISEQELEVAHKSQMFIEYIVNPIQKYELKHKRKVFDTIGNTGRCTINTIADDFLHMLEILQPYNIPLEITEFAMCLPPTLLEGIKEEDLHNFKSIHLDDVFSSLASFKEQYHILNGINISSISDRMDYALININQVIYTDNELNEQKGLKPRPLIDHLYGGYYDKNMDVRKNST